MCCFDKGANCPRERSFWLWKQSFSNALIEFELILEKVFIFVSLRNYYRLFELIIQTPIWTCYWEAMNWMFAMKSLDDLM
jgi:hypothetical protein